MPIARRLERFMKERGVTYDVVLHRPTPSSSKTAEATHISGHNLAKAVVLKDQDGYAVAVLPASRHVRLNALQEWLNRNFALASEEEIGEIFVDCDLGAVPAVGDAYGLDVLVDNALSDAEDVYIEGGDHKSLLHLTAKEFEHLMEHAEHGSFSSTV